jgi:hypothetical protein
MGRLVTLTVKLKFTDKIVSDEEYQEIVDNVTEGIHYQIEKVGVAPEESEALTAYFEVSEKYSGASSKRVYIEDPKEPTE